MPLTIKENFMRCITGGVPEFVPRFHIGPVAPESTIPQQNAFIACSVRARKKSPRGYNQDIWGVEYVGTADTGGQELPVPGEFLLDDICNWRDVIKAPDLSDIDWEAVAKKDLENLPVNHEEVALVGNGAASYFMQLMNFMGFTNGLTAFYEEPDEVKALFAYLHEFYLKFNEKFMEYYPLDLFHIGDDTATATNPFISMDMYREFIKPFVLEDTKFARDRGMPVMMHNCGRCEDFISDWLDYGVHGWDPAQIINDLEGIKARLGNRLVLIGCWDSHGPVSWDPTCSEEFVRSEVKRVIDTFAPGGGFMFNAGVLGSRKDELLNTKRDWITSEYEARRFDPYK